MPEGAILKTKCKNVLFIFLLKNSISTYATFLFSQKKKSVILSKSENLQPSKNLEPSPSSTEQKFLGVEPVGPIYE